MSASGPVSPRIPAWKRLGLKLKSEGDAPSPVAAAEPPAYVAAEQPKRKRSADEVESTPIKKSKKSLKDKTPAASSTPTNLPEDKQDRRKSVAFTPDTKTEDGDSIKQLFSSWVAEQKKNDPLFQSKKDNPALQITSPSVVEEKFDTTLDESERRVKRVKPANSDEKTKPKKAKLSKVVKPKPIDPALTYLTQFHGDKANWKFNKINQITVLKNAFDTNLIPNEYNQPLFEYIAGLKGVARLHLRDRALVIRDKDTEDGEKAFTNKMSDEDRAKKQEEYETAIDEYVATMTASAISSRTGHEEGELLRLHPDTAMKERMAKRMRTERVLNLLASTPGDPTEYAPVMSDKQPVEESKPQLALEEQKPQKTVRKRKQRTAVYESDSSSSDDSSDSGTSDEDESDDEGKGQKPEEEDSDTSSSGSSSDSSSDDSDSSDSEGSEGDDSSSSSSSSSSDDDDDEDGAESD